MIKPELDKMGFKYGRDKLRKLLRSHNLLIKRRTPFKPKTTRQDPALKPSLNLLKETTITAPNQAFCSDITYLITKKGVAYLSLISDMYARDIVGWHLAENLTTEGPLNALKMAMRQLPKGITPIAHSDRGCQYASHKYRDYLASHGWQSSMTEELHCYENAMAERINGILKNEYYLDFVFPSIEDARAAVKRAIDIYNNHRPHQSLNYRTPTSIRKAFKTHAA